MQARFSKWISVDLLIDEKEFDGLISSCNPMHLISTHNAAPKTPFLVDKKKLIKVYSSYISELKSGKLPAFDDYKKYFYLMISANLDGVFIRKIGKDKQGLIFNAPLIEVKPICLVVSNVDQSIRPMPVHPDGILWGLRFSFPQIIQDAKTLKSEQIDFQKHPTGNLFKQIRSWIRQNTRATPFIIDSKKVNHPVRLGKNCFEWINNHPQIKKSSICINS